MEKTSIISRWSQFFIDKYKTTLLVVLAIVIAGIFGALNNQRQDFPSIPSNYIGVNATYIGASAADIEREVLIPIEQALSEVDGVKRITGRASDNFGSVTLEMNDVDGTEDAAEEVEKLVSRTGLAGDVETTVSIYDAIGPSAVYTLTSETADKNEILQYSDDIKQKLLSASTEVKEIEVVPDNEFQVTITYDADKLNDKGVSGNAYTSAIESALSSLPGGFVEKDSGESLSIAVEAPAQSLDDIEAIEVNEVPLRDIATVVREPKDIESITLAGFLDENSAAQIAEGEYPKDRTVYSRDGVYLFVYKKDDGDVIRIAEALEEATQEINESNVLPENILLAEVYDNSGYVEDQISALIDNGLLGLILILVVLMLFINLRTGIVVAGIIPLAFLGTLGILFAIGFSINILTLFGLLLVLGILVDNAIVIAEGVVHGIEGGKSKDEAVKETMRHLGPAVTAATLTTVVVFIPFASIGGIIGAFLKFIPYTIIIMLLMSFFLALTVTPALAKLILKEETKKQRREKKLKTWQKWTVLPWLIYLAQKGIDRLEDAYADFNKWVHHSTGTKLLVVFVTLAFFIGSVSFFGSKLAVEQFPSDDSNVILVSFDAPAEAGFDVRNEAVERVMGKAVAADYLQSYYYYEGTIQMIFDDPEDRPEGNDITVLHEQVEELIAEEVDAVFADTGIEVSVETAGVGPPESSYDVTVEIRGTNLEDLGNAADDIAGFLENRNDVAEVANAYSDNAVAGMEINFRNDDLRDTGIDATQANFAVRGVFAENTVGSVITRDDGISDDVVVRYSESSTNEQADLEELVVGVDTGNFPPEEVRLKDIADISEVSKLKSIRRMDGKRVVAIQAKGTEDADSAVIEADVKEYIEDVLGNYNLEIDDVVYGGFAASNDENFANLSLVFMLAIIAVYLILVYQFNSFVQPGLILFTVPMALIGVFPGLNWVGSSINMISGLGIVALVGIVVNDAIVFMDYYNRLRSENPKKSLAEVVVMTGRARFKPILSTSITTIFGILPLTIADPFWRGLGVSLIGGLICSTIGTLIVFPVLISWADTFLQWMMKMMRKLMPKKK